MNLEKLLFNDKDVDLSLVPGDLLAFIGDSFHSLYIKTKIVVSGELKVGVVHERSKGRIFFKAQAAALEKILNILDESEKALVKRVINSKGAKRYGNDPNYRKSTAFEALIGYLYLSKKFDRIKQLFDEVEKCSSME
ncbi:MAG: ribonuclease III [Thermotogae bacterium]|nr:ribonuclease III [Thermotogota bacterium]